MLLGPSLVNEKKNRKQRYLCLVFMGLFSSPLKESMEDDDAEKPTLQGTLNASRANDIIHHLRLTILKIIYNQYVCMT